MIRERKGIAKPGVWEIARRDEVWIPAAALVLRLLVCLWAWARVPPTADGQFYHIVASRIAEGQGYTWLWPDGVVTHAAHYPVGYPLMMGALYALLGKVPGYVMLQNAVVGAASVWATHRVCRDELEGRVSLSTARRAARAAALLVALSPTLVFYTSALMTEAEVASLTMLCLALTWEIRRRPRAWLIVVVSLGLGFVVLLRPQMVLLVPLLGALSVSGERLHAGKRLLMASAFVLIGAFVVLPWTARNCHKMERCVFVSANGGWNLLIGTFPEGQGAWVPLNETRVPRECREVYQEAEKDVCFRTAGMRRISHDPTGWLALAPKKLRATFDYSSPAADHLMEAGAPLGWAQRVLKWSEYAWQRVLTLLSLLALLGPAGRLRRSRSRQVLLVFGAILSSTSFAWLTWVGIFGGTLTFARALLRPGWGLAASALGTTLLIHGVFFGASRYALPALVLAAPIFAWGIVYIIDALNPSDPMEAGDFDSQKLRG